MNNRNTLNWKWILLATILYALVFVVYTYPLITQFTTHFIADKPRGGDPAQYTWNSYVFKQNLMAFRNLFYSDYTFYPLGTNLLFHTYTPLISIFSLPFSNLFLALNLFTFLQFVLSGLGALFLSQRLFKNYSWGLVVGFVFAFSAYKMMHLLGHYHLMLTATIPFYIMALMDTFSFSEKAKIPRIINWKSFSYTAVLFMLTFLSDYYAAFYLIFFTGFYLIFPYFRNLFLKTNKLVAWACIFMVFLGGHYLASFFHFSYKVYDKGAFWWAPDVSLFFVPSYNSKWFTTESYYNSIGEANIETPIFLGWTLALLSIFMMYLWLKHKENKSSGFYFFVFILLFFVGMTTPDFKLMGVHWFYLPTANYHFIPFLNNIRIPGRAAMMVFLLLPIVLGYLLTSYKSFINPVLYKWIPIVALVLLFLEYWPKTYQTAYKDVNIEVATWLKAKPGNVIFALPLGLEDGFIHYDKPDVGLMTDQMTHGKKILGGYASRVHDDVFAYYNTDSICQTMYLLQKESRDTSLSQREAYKVDPELIKKFLLKFKPDLILVQPTYKNKIAHHFVKLNFGPYIVSEDSLNDNVLYTLKRP